MPATSGPARPRRTSRPSSTFPAALLDDDGLEALAELRPEDEDGLVLARRVFADGRTRAYAWGRSAAREDLAAAGERLIAMSGQFEQRRLARPSYQLDVLDAFAGEEQLRRRAELRGGVARAAGRAAPARGAERGAAADEARLEELRALAEDAEGLDAEPRRRSGPSASGCATSTSSRGRRAAAEALAPEDGEGAAALAAAAERAVAPLAARARARARAATSSATPSSACARRRASCAPSSTRSRPSPAGWSRSSPSSSGSPTRSGASGARPTRSSSRGPPRRGRSSTAREGGPDPRAGGGRGARRRRSGVRRLCRAPRGRRRAAAEPFAEAVAAELHGIGMGEGEFRAELRERGARRDRRGRGVLPHPPEPRPAVRPGRRDGVGRRAVARRARDRGRRRRETLVFDEIDAGIGGQTANAVGEALRRLAERAQVLTITHLPQIASLADRHFRVEKVPGDPTHTTIERLARTTAAGELERMLGGQEFLRTVR